MNTEITFTGEMQKLSLKDGDVLVLKFKKRIAPQFARIVEDQMRKSFPNNEYIILQDDFVELEVRSNESEP